MNDGKWLAVTNWRKYQMYKVDEPYYVKLFVHILDDKKVQALPPLARLLWYQMLPLAARYQNAIPYNVTAIAKETKLERHTVAKHLRDLVVVRLLYTTATPRRIFDKPRRDPVELMETFIQNGGRELTNASLLDEMGQRGVPESEHARLLELAGQA